MYNNRTFKFAGGSSGFARAPYSPNYAKAPYMAAMPPKRSGCKVKQLTDKTFIVSAWKKDRYGFHVLYARPYKKTVGSISKSGKKWLNLFVTITNRSTMQVTNCSGMFDVDKQKLYVSDLNLVANPRAARGGYFGKHISKR